VRKNQLTKRENKTTIKIAEKSFYVCFTFNYKIQCGEYWDEKKKRQRCGKSNCELQNVYLLLHIHLQSVGLLTFCHELFIVLQ